ncbi:polymeric immunoglobulin receptor-like [Neoarius graeffei]|uniref:polymeric immunoglobulin receptor-like n=1 Tax=Neoarius graeffei TaxID=443677 RepID=UPI00298C1976|nr:polymeric immunoglobulin receptor-like [Neoarius graeffei]
MKILLIFTLCLISDGGASKEVTGYSGGGVLVKCKYDTKYTQNPKYFCKGSPLFCSDQIKTGAKNTSINLGRFSLFDDTKSAEFRVMIRELTVQDTGTYQCGVDIPKEIDIYTWVDLEVKEDLSYEKSISKTVHVGGDLNISCKYPESIRSGPKFLCKTKLQQAAYFYKESVKESIKDGNGTDSVEWLGEFSLYDDRPKQIFTVSIRNVTEQDSGEYWCGAEAAWTTDHGYKVYFTRINLIVTATSSSPPSPPSWLPPASSPPGFSASTVIPVFMIVLLLLIGIIFLIVILQIKCTMKAGTACIFRSSVQHSQNNQMVPLDVCDYEEIRDTRKRSASDAATSTVYTTAQLPAVPSDSQNIYANMVLHTGYCESMYSTPKLPTNHPDQDIYSTAQLPTNLSDSSVF